MTSLLLFAIVILAAIALVVLELLKTFGRDVLAALRSRWAWALIGVNVIVALARAATHSSDGRRSPTAPCPARSGNLRQSKDTLTR